MTERVIVASSSGKDSILALHEISKEPGYKIAALLCTITGDYHRISMHGVRVELLKNQARSLKIPLELVSIPKDADNTEYEKSMKVLLERYQKDGINYVVFGDIFLEDVKNYRIENLARVNMNGLFPLWGKDTTTLSHDFIDLGFKAIVTCVDGDQLEGNFAGREYDREFLSELPENVDPCGENGEFHTFVHDGPNFDFPVKFEIGEKVLRENRFYFRDLIPI